MKKILALSLACALSLSLLTGCGGGSGSGSGNGVGGGGGSQTLSMGTGSSGGTYYALGGVMATAMESRMDGITISPQASGASVENMNMINAGEFDLGIAMNATAVLAHEGRDAFEGNVVTNVRAIGVVYHEVYQIVAAASTGATEVEDLAGLTIAVGPAGSGTIGCTEAVLSAAGMDINTDIKPQNDSFGDASTKMQDGHIDAACNTLTVPASSIQEMLTAMDLNYINISDEILAKIQETQPYYSRYVIPAGTYDRQTEDINTITCEAVLYCRADLDEETVYQVTKAFYESADEIAAGHTAGKDISLEGALNGVTTPVHPGAARYYEEMGIEVDPSLIID